MNRSSAPSPPALQSSDGELHHTVEALSTIAVVGAGSTAVCFVERCLSRGLSVILEDVLPSNLRSASAVLNPVLASEHHGCLRMVHTVEDAVRGADLAIDFVPDELESKLEIASMIDRMAPPRTIFCTPTDALSIADLASCTYRADRCFALHSLSSALAAVEPAPLRVSFPLNADPAARRSLEGLVRLLGFAAVSEPDTLASQLMRRR